MFAFYNGGRNDRRVWNLDRYRLRLLSGFSLPGIPASPPRITSRIRPPSLGKVVHRSRLQRCVRVDWSRLSLSKQLSYLNERSVPQARTRGATVNEPPSNHPACRWVLLASTVSRVFPGSTTAHCWYGCVSQLPATSIPPQRETPLQQTSPTENSAAAAPSVLPAVRAVATSEAATRLSV
jgi:hypothetical protein